MRFLMVQRPNICDVSQTGYYSFSIYLVTLHFFALEFWRHIFLCETNEANFTLKKKDPFLMND